MLEKHGLLADFEKVIARCVLPDPLTQDPLPDPLLNTLYQEIYKAPDTCQLLLSDLLDQKKSSNQILIKELISGTYIF